jgi:hypothetical protein
MANRRLNAFGLVWLMLLAPIAGCFGENEVDGVGSDSLVVEEKDRLEGGMWQQITLSANEDLAVFIPYFVQDPGSMRAQNGTVLDLKGGETVAVNVLFPPRNPDVVLFVGDHGRINWPIRAADESWMSWLNGSSSGSSVQAVPNQDDGGLWPWLVPGNISGGDVIPVVMQTIRPERSDLTDADGVGASDGWVNGRDVYEWVDFITDDTPCATCGPDGAVGYLDRWIETPTRRMNTPSRTLKA